MEAEEKTVAFIFFFQLFMQFIYLKDKETQGNKN